MAKITLKEIAAMANVSAMTVSNVVHGKDSKVSKHVKEKVLNLVEQYNYVPNQNASNLRTGSSKMIGVVFYTKEKRIDFTDPFISSVLTGIENIARKNGYFTMIQSIRSSSEIEILQRNWTFAGFIAVGVSSEDFIKVDKKFHTPVSYIDTYPPKGQNLVASARNFIGTDEASVSKLAVDYLINKGHKNILFYSFEFDEKPSVIQNRFLSFKKFFERNGGKKFEISTARSSTYQDVLKSVEPYLVSQPFTAIYATADILAVKLNQIFKGISIIGVDNAEFSEFISPKLTTIAIDQVKKGEIAMKYLIKSIRTGVSNNFYSKSSLIERESVQPKKD
ncbi:MAG: LacI family transcriptional regulator [Streptococcaceae bacterium]|jgi:LacI family transcriptional regulator|nr:LacI family transcriptional regulator [Streptococcaceae bacterium]